MKVFGLTGGIGMGKSTAAQILRDRGIAVVDTDALARELVEPGQPALEELKKIFGAELISANGQLRRDELARRVFADSAARKKLEDVLHPRIRERWLAQVETWRTEGKPSAIVVIPLLFETKAESRFDATICVACSAETQRRRLLERGWTVEQIQQRIAAQLPAETKAQLSDFVIWTEGSVELHAEQLQRIVCD